MEYALVTGACSGMGLEFARCLAGKGYGIIIVSNRPEDNRAAAQSISLEYPDRDVRIIDSDLSRQQAAKEVYSCVKSWGLQVDVLVSNAGILLFSTLSNTSLEALDLIVSLHCSTPAKLVKLFGDDMKARGHGYILVTSSSTAWMQFPTISHYGATKAFLKNFTRSVWYEYRRFGVGVTALFPGAVDTPLYKLSDSKRSLLRKAGVMMSAKRVAEVALKKMFKRKYKCIPGVFTRVSVMLCRIAPVWMILVLLRVPAVKRIFDNV